MHVTIQLLQSLFTKQELLKWSILFVLGCVVKWLLTLTESEAKKFRKHLYRHHRKHHRQHARWCLEGDCDLLMKPESSQLVPLELDSQLAALLLEP